MTAVMGETASRSLTADQLVVPVASEVFSSHPNASFYLGIVAANGMVYNPELYRAAGLLRANVYIDEKKFVGEDHRQPDGTERDLDDPRSIHFAAVENGRRVMPDRVVGGLRLVLKETVDAELPIERLYKDQVFRNKAAPVRSAEVSRFISRHPDKPTQALVGMGLMRAAAGWLDLYVHKPAFAVVEASLARLFDGIELPYEKLSDFKELPEYANTRNIAIRMDPSAAINETRADKRMPGIGMDTFFSSAEEHRGIGYFNANLARIARETPQSHFPKAA